MAVDSSGRQSALLEMIDEQFGNLSRPNEPLVVETLDDEGVSAHFIRLNPMTMSEADAEEWSTALWFFTVEAFVYFLRPYLRAIIKSRQNGTTLGHFLSQLGSDLSSSRIERAAGIVTLLSTVQRDALLAVLEHVEEGLENDDQFKRATLRLRQGHC